eukprot:jgi/Mesvir1/14599/Mv05270-RA.1
MNRPSAASFVRVLAAVVAHDNARHEIVGGMTVVVPPNAVFSDDDKRAVDVIRRILDGTYALDGATFVDMPAHPARVSNHVNITSGESNGPVPRADFLASDTTMSSFHAIPMADGGTAYAPKTVSASVKW